MRNMGGFEFDIEVLGYEKLGFPFSNFRFVAFELMIYGLLSFRKVIIS